MVLFTILYVNKALSSGISTAFIMFGILAFKGLVLFSLGAYFLGVTRFYVYGGLMAGGFVGAELLGSGKEIARGWDIVAMFGLPALVMLPIGAVILTRFLRSHPVR